MNIRDESIGQLKKVGLMMEWGGQQSLFEFIYGTGPGGLSPFEFELAGKRVGHNLELHLARKDLAGFFEHLLPPPVLEDVPEVFALTVRVVKIGQADEREVIKAMAEASACGSRCCGH
jgi:hypothetical protein